MVRKSDLLLLVMAIVVAVPGCGGKKNAKPKSNKTAFSRVNMPLADDVALADESIRSFFDEGMQEFVAFTQNGDDFELIQDNATFSWLDEEQDLKNVYFDYDKNKVRKDQEDKLTQNVDRIKELLEVQKSEGRDAKVVVEGHSCKFYRNKDYNFALSEKRAKEVTDQLVARGIDPNDIKTVGRGSEMVVREDGSKADQWINRRVELHVVSENQAAA